MAIGRCGGAEDGGREVKRAACALGVVLLGIEKEVRRAEMRRGADE
jgi:hypothetical protein